MTKKYHKITKQIGFSYLFTILTFVLSPILIVLLTRTLSITEYGVYSILSATISILKSIFILGLSGFIITRLPSFKYPKKVRAMFSIITFELVFLLAILSILFIPLIQNTLLFYLKIEGYKLEFQLSLIIIFVSLFFNLFSYYLVANRKMEFNSFVCFLSKCLWIIFLIPAFLILKKINLPIVFSIWLLGFIVSLIIIVLYIRKDVSFFFAKVKTISSPLLKNALFFSLPLVPVTMSSWIITVADRYMLNYYKGAALTGIYSLSYSLVGIVLAFSAIISTVLYPYIAKAWGEKKNHHILFNAMLKYSLMIILPAMVGLLVMREQIITLVSGIDYIAGSSAIVILISFPLFDSLINIYTRNLLLREKTKIMSSVYISGAILNIVLNVLLIPRYGINGAAIATIISYSFMFIVFYFISRKQFSWDFEFLRIFRIIAASILMGIIILLINPQIYITKIISIILGIIIYVSLLFLFRVFVGQEHTIMRRFLPKRIKKLIP